jgi:hypothetical protein
MESIAAKGAGGVLEQTSYLPKYYFHNGKTNVPRHCVGRTLEYDNGESCVKNSVGFIVDRGVVAEGMFQYLDGLQQCLTVFMLHFCGNLGRAGRFQIVARRRR